MFVGYLKKSGFELYEIKFKKKGEISNIIKADVSSTKGIKNLLTKKLLIIDKELCLHVRKKYPPASKPDIQKAVALDINDIFPLNKPSYYLKVTTHQAHTVADIWGWDNSMTEAIKDKFQFMDVYPEEACFTSDNAEITVFIEHELMYVIVHDKTGFLGSIVSKRIEPQQILNLMRITRLDTSDLGQIKVYSDRHIKIPDLPTELLPKITYKAIKDYPIAIEYASLLDIKKFPLKTLININLPEQKEIYFRAIIYILSGYLLSVFISGYYYDLSTRQMRENIALINSNLSNISTKPRDLQELEKDVTNRLKDAVSPIDVMNLLAKYLPVKTFVRKMTITEKSVELHLVTDQPLNIVNTLNEIQDIASVKIKGAINKDHTGQYNLTVILVML